MSAATTDTLQSLLTAGPGPGVGPLHDLRDAGRAALAKTGLPGRKTEIWKYTRLKALDGVAWTGPDARPEIDGDWIDAQAGFPDAWRIVLVNGRFDAGLSRLTDLPSAARIAPLPEAAGAHGAVAAALGQLADAARFPMVALNAACLEDGVAIGVEERALLEKPIHIVSITAPGAQPVAAHPRLLIRIGAGAQATLLESHLHLGDGAPAFTNAVLEIMVGEGARLGHYRIHDGPENALFVATTAVSVAGGAQYDAFALNIGAGLARNESVYRLDGERAEIAVNGAYLGVGGAHIDNTTFIDHAKPNCQSQETFKGVLSDHARGVFQGKILVRPDAQNTDGHQMHKALLLSGKAEVDAKPELEIYADDVRCGHGATIGALDADQLFYLRARGVDEETARSLLIEAFLLDTVERIQDLDVREAFAKALTGRLRALQSRLAHGEAA